MNLALLSDLLGDRLLRFRLPSDRARALAALLQGHVDGVGAASIAEIDRMIGAHGVTRVFLDGSNLGALAHAIRRKHPRVRILTFCHNVETRFFLGAFRAHRTARSAAVLAANHRAERAAARSSDILTCLSERDGRTMQRFHRRRPDAILPLTISDTYRPAPSPADAAPRHALFVGGGFYANVDGLRWYLRDIAPHAGMPTVIVGRGLEALADLCRGRPDVRLVGEVDDLTPWYRAAHIVIAPILDGSGMKTKVAEALMHGKHVIGTPEALSGYDGAVHASVALCPDAARFGQAVREAGQRELPAFDPAMRALYERFHSFSAGRERMARVLSRLASSER